MKKLLLALTLIFSISLVAAADFNIYQPSSVEYQESPEFWVYVQHDEPGELSLELNGETVYSDDFSGGKYGFLEGKIFNLSEGDYSYQVNLETDSNTFESESRNFTLLEPSPSFDIDYIPSNNSIAYSVGWNQTGEVELLSGDEVLDSNEFQPPRQQWLTDYDEEYEEFRIRYKTSEETYISETYELSPDITSNQVEEDTGQDETDNNTDQPVNQPEDSEDLVSEINSNYLVYIFALFIVVLIVAAYLLRDRYDNSSENVGKEQTSGSIDELKEKYNDE